MQLMHVDENLCYQILHEYVIPNREVDFNDIAYILRLFLIL
jgi:hypothetical protein